MASALVNGYAATEHVFAAPAIPCYRRRAQLRSPVSLVDLNADCLIHLYKYLDVTDITKLSEASSALSQFAEENIYRKLTTIKSGHFYELVRQGMWSIALKHLGNYLTHVTVNADALARPTIADVLYVFQMCPNLYQLRLKYFTFNQARDYKLLHELDLLALAELELHCCTGINSGLDHFISKFTDLHTVTMSSVSKLACQLTVIFPYVYREDTMFGDAALKSLPPGIRRLELSHFKLAIDDPLKILLYNPQLEQLVLEKCVRFLPLDDIVEYLNRLVEIDTPRPVLELTIVSQCPVNWPSKWGTMKVDKENPLWQLNIKDLMKLEFVYSGRKRWLHS